MEVNELNRRFFIKGLTVTGAAIVSAGLLDACSLQANVPPTNPDTKEQVPVSSEQQQALVALPLAAPDPNDQFGIDLNVNINTIDDWLFRDDVAYRDVRMLFDPARYEDVGGKADLTSTILGFKVVPYPYVGTLQQLPVQGAYEGERLFDVVWADDGSIIQVAARFRESVLVLEDLFPRDMALFLMCGGGGYSAMLKTLLVHQGWDASRIYNIGANWIYAGPNALELTVLQDSETLFATWRASYALLDFTMMHRLT